MATWFVLTLLERRRSIAVQTLAWKGGRWIDVKSEQESVSRLLMLNLIAKTGEQKEVYLAPSISAPFVRCLFNLARYGLIYASKDIRYSG